VLDLFEDRELNKENIKDGYKRYMKGQYNVEIK